jgi:ribonuclease Z
MDLAGMLMEGVSVGGLESCLEFPHWKVAVDMGSMRRGTERYGTVCFTHAHADHLGAIALHLARRGLMRLPDPTYVVHPDVVKDVEQLIATWRKLDHADLGCRVLPLEPGTSHRVGNDLRVRPFRTVHRVVSQGYVFTTRAKRLDPKYVELGGAELGRLRKEGVEIDLFTDVDELAITGDTRIEGVVEHADVLRARRLVMEVTFLDERVPRAKAREQGHTHLDDVVEHRDAFQNELICMSHISPRYKASEIAAILDARLPANLRERVVWFR